MGVPGDPPLANAGALTERVAVRGPRPGDVFRSTLGKGKFHVVAGFGALSSPQLTLKKIAWAVLESLPEGPLDSGPDAAFKWWLWLGNLGPLSRDILGAGVVSAFLDHQGVFVRHLVCERSDGSQVTVALSLTRNGALETKSWCTRPPA